MPLFPFGEKVLFKPLKKTGDLKNSLQPKFRFAFYLGSRSRSGEHFVGTPEGVVRCRDVRRLTDDKRWDLDGLKAVKGALWAPVNGAAALEVPTHIVTEKVVREEEDGEFRRDVNMISFAHKLAHGRSCCCERLILSRAWSRSSLNFVHYHACAGKPSLDLPPFELLLFCFWCTKTSILLHAHIFWVGPVLSGKI